MPGPCPGHPGSPEPALLTPGVQKSHLPAFFPQVVKWWVFGGSCLFIVPISSSLLPPAGPSGQLEGRSTLDELRTDLTGLLKGIHG